MNITITKRENYIHHCDVRKYLTPSTDRIEKEIFGKKIFLANDPWLWHTHIKFCETCNAKCKFCIEQKSCRKEKTTLLLNNLTIFLTQMKTQKILYSVSVTGGEPTLHKDFPALCKLLTSYKEANDIHFLTINTNGTYLATRHAEMDGLFDFINISRHAINDEENYKIFKTRSVPSLSELKNLKKTYTKSKMRLQCVLQKDMSITDFDNMIEAYRFMDNLSFRRLMSSKDDLYEDMYENSYFTILDHVSKHGKLVEQTIQDYYVYEIWNYHDTNITFSYSDMKALSEIEKTESDSIIREFIIHPDGKISGSWNENEKIFI